MTRRDELMQLIVDYARQYAGNSPSLRNLTREARRAGYEVSLSAVRQHLTKLEAEHRLTRADGQLIVVGAEWLPPTAFRTKKPQRIAHKLPTKGMQ